MLITFLETRLISEDGHTVKRFHKGETKEVADAAARAAINNGWAKPIEPQDDMETVVNKIIASLHLNGFPKAEAL